MTKQLTGNIASLLALAGLRTLSAYRAPSIVALALGASRPIVCAGLAQRFADWVMFERSASITAAFDLVVAARRYFQYGILEPAMLWVNESPKSQFAVLLEEDCSAKLGLVPRGIRNGHLRSGQVSRSVDPQLSPGGGFFIIRYLYRDFAHLRRGRTD